MTSATISAPAPATHGSPARHRREHAEATPRALGRPVFYDRTGKRWRRFVVVLIAIVGVVVGLAAWITPSALAPLWTAPVNAGKEYPRELLAAGNPDAAPVIGDEETSVLDRVVRVVREPAPCPDDSGEVGSCARVNLLDPFTGAVLRQATEDEAERIGNTPYAVEHYGQLADHQLMLTFDDGPDPIFTAQLLDILSREKVPATFFVIGSSVVENPDVLKRIVREGHMVGNHTMSHIDFEGHDDARNREELIGADRIIRATAGYSSSLFRIPRGNPDKNVLALLQSQQLGYLHINDNLDTRDWSYPAGEDVPVPQLDGRGHVVLMHDGGGDRTATLRMVERLIAQAKQQGYTFTTLAPLVPSAHLPQLDVEPSLADRSTLHAIQAFVVLPGKLFGFLFWLGTGSLAIMSVLYLVLALIGQHRQNRGARLDFADQQLPFVSVVLAAYNEEKVIARTLAELRNSDYPATKFEVIAVNDGSTDATLEILQQCAGEWVQLRVIDQVNSGKSSALNNGINHANPDSTVIVTLDADTIFDKQTIRMLARHFVETGDGRPVGAVAGNIRVGNRRNIITAWQSLEYITGIGVTRMAERTMSAISIVPGACSAWRREALVQIGGFCEDTMAEDADATLALQRLGYRITQENKAIADTEAPETIRGLAKQRKRWTFGIIQALWKHRTILFRPRYGMLGMLAMPYALFTLAVPLIFMPVTLVGAGLSLANGNWRSIAVFAAIVATLHLVVAVAAIAMLRERPWHLLVIPVYRLIYEPLKVYLLYASAYRVIKGAIVQWDKLERRNSVSVVRAGVD